MKNSSSLWLEKIREVLSRDWRITSALAIVIIGGAIVFATFNANSIQSPSAADILPASVKATAISTTPPVAPKSGHTPAKTSGRKKSPATLAATATPQSNTQLNLANPYAKQATQPTQSLAETIFGFIWRLALVIALIYLTMRGLAALKKSGFSLQKKNSESKASFFDNLEEIKLSPQLSLHAIRAGSKVFILARIGGAVQQLGEVTLDSDEQKDKFINELKSDRFLQTLTMAIGQNNTTVGDMQAIVSGKNDTALSLPTEHSTVTSDDLEVVDGKWTTVNIQADDPIQPTVREKDSKTEQQVNAIAGVARAADKVDKNEQLDPSFEREVLWHAEQFSVGAAAQKYGIPYQRIVAMRKRYGKNKTQKQREKLRQQNDSFPLAADHPKPFQAESSGFTIALPKASLIRAIYGKNKQQATKDTKPEPTVDKNKQVKPDVDTGIDPMADAAASQIAQILAERFNIRNPPSIKKPTVK